MRIFIAGVHTETNTFAPIPTGVESFEEGLLAHGDATRRPLNHCSTQLAVWRRLAEERGFEVIESLCAYAEPGGLTSRPVYEAFRAEILADLRAAGPVEGILLSLHGAMAAQGYDDVEGDLLSRLRLLVGTEVAIGAELDLHCHLTRTMCEAATVLVTYKEFPHTDFEARAEELFKLIVNTAEGRVKPLMRTFDCRMIGLFPTQNPPVRTFVDRMRALERGEDILSVSLAHGFPWGDVEEVGTKVLVVADGAGQKAEALAQRLGLEFYQMRRTLTPPSLSMDEALERAMQVPGGPVVLADTADNPGGGAPSDSTFLIKRILEKGIRSVVSGLYWDPMAVRFCREAGEGARLDLRIGGKAGATSGGPLDLRVTVRRVATGVTQLFGPVPAPIGEAAWVESEGVDLVLTSRRVQTLHPKCMTTLGIDLKVRKLIVVKSINHFYAGFAPIAREVLFVDTPGALQRRFDRIPYTKLSRPLWPKVDDPLGVDTLP